MQQVDRLSNGGWARRLIPEPYFDGRPLYVVPLDAGLYFASDLMKGHRMVLKDETFGQPPEHCDGGDVEVRPLRRYAPAWITNILVVSLADKPLMPAHFFSALIHKAKKGDRETLVGHLPNNGMIIAHWVDERRRWQVWTGNLDVQSFDKSTQVVGLPGTFRLAAN